MIKKRPAAALSALLCALMLLALTGCGRGVASDHPDRTEFVSVAELKIDAVSETASYSGPEYMDGTVCVYDSFVTDPYGSTRYGTGEPGVTTPMVLDLQTGEVRELGISFPYVLENGRWFNLDPYQELYWYRDGLWYLILERSYFSWGIYTFDQATGELAPFLAEIPNCFSVDSILLADDTLYLTTATVVFFALQAVDLNTGEVTELARFENPKFSETTHMILLECTEQTLYLKEESEQSTLRGADGPTSYDGDAHVFRIYAVDRTSGEVTATTMWLNSCSMSNACGRLLCFVDPVKKAVKTVDLVTGAVHQAVQEKELIRVSDAAVCGRVLVEVNGGAYLYDLESGESFPIPYCGFDIVRLVRETPSHVIFTVRTENGVNDWVADRSAFEDGRMDETNTFRLTDR